MRERINELSTNLRTLGVQRAPPPADTPGTDTGIGAGGIAIGGGGAAIGMGAAMGVAAKGGIF